MSAVARALYVTVCKVRGCHQFGQPLTMDHMLGDRRHARAWWVNEALRQRRASRMDDLLVPEWHIDQARAAIRNARQLKRCIREAP